MDLDELPEDAAAATVVSALALLLSTGAEAAVLAAVALALGGVLFAVMGRRPGA